MSVTTTDDALIRVDWPAPSGVQAWVTTRHGGVSAMPFDCLNLATHVGDDPSSVEENRRRLRRLAHLPAEPRWLNQVHGTEVATGDASTCLPDADASYTDAANVVLAILTADCLPVTFCSDDGRELAVAHAGWRGLAAGVLGATVARFSASPESIMAWLGPAIGPQAFEVGEEVRSTFVAANPEDAVGFVAGVRPGKYQADLFALARLSLRRAGVQRVFGGGICTFNEAETYYSYRRDAGRTGRMATLIWRTDAD
ncbi:multi-copper polyphenol oxidoreductase [Halothiobacillus diazotrophicus]|uniref:Purine nucleoside phosphorylase n=1 Tax=Halothiobacillus diazotrophicus TaxID=1860122 RepID=A0A191ZIX0_9GAMM|nr:multi-copper polyphenol oxidoreductase [Halothiobacillus diazotrophicus]